MACLITQGDHNNLAHSTLNISSTQCQFFNHQRSNGCLLYYCTDNKRRRIITVIDKLFGSMVWFQGSTNPKKIFLIGRAGPNRQSISQMAITSVVCDISAEFCFDIWFQLSAHLSMTLPYTRDKGTLPWQPILGQKLLSMHLYERLGEWYYL